MTEKMLAKITQATFGYGGYQEAMFGLSLTFESDGSACGAFEGTWSMPPSANAEWTTSDQDAHWAKAVRLLLETVKKSKKRHVGELVGTPVELTFDRPFGKLESWRVLTEVI